MTHFLIFDKDPSGAAAAEKIMLHTFVQCNAKVRVAQTKEEVWRLLQDRFSEFHVVFVSLSDVEDARAVANAFRKGDLRTALAFYGGDYAALSKVMIFRPSAHVPEHISEQGKSYFKRVVLALYSEREREIDCFAVKRDCDIVKVRYKPAFFY
ncbi:hypothetical protein AGMMS50276_03600 [Synergistales bacterium]|nr:hypothetical protein AGMMS50276_03600 [Synergistales bacterium]